MFKFFIGLYVGSTVKRSLGSSVGLELGPVVQN